VQQELDRRGRLVAAHQHRGVVGVVLVDALVRVHPPAPLNGSIRLRLFVPRIQRLVARNWNFASSG
jgi:hypothetical protein